MLWFYFSILAILIVYNVALSVIVLKLIPLCLPSSPEDRKTNLVKQMKKFLKLQGRGKRGRPKKDDVHVVPPPEPKRDADGNPVEEF